jgi:hypothetical protein
VYITDNFDDDITKLLAILIIYYYCADYIDLDIPLLDDQIICVQGHVSCMPTK